MDDFKRIVDTFFSWVIMIYNFFSDQHPIIQAIFFMPMALMVLVIFFAFVGKKKEGRL